MKLNVLDKKGKNVGEVTLSDDVFGVTPNEDVLTRYLRILTHNQRQGTSKVKTRGEVSGGGKKPWRQKKTGRARHGSTRSPLWVGGGITHGPTPKSWTLIFPRKMRTLAIKSALSYQFINNKALIVDKFELKEPKTKALVDLLSSLKVDRKVLLVTKDAEPIILKSAKNLPNIRISFAGNLNGHEILKSHNIIFTKEAVLALEEKYKK